MRQRLRQVCLQGPIEKPHQTSGLGQDHGVFTSSIFHEHGTKLYESANAPTEWAGF